MQGADCAVHKILIVGGLRGDSKVVSPQGGTAAEKATVPFSGLLRSPTTPKSGRCSTCFAPGLRVLRNLLALRAGFALFCRSAN